MKKLIDADKLIHDIPEQIDITKRMLDKVIKVIDNQEPVREEGRWIPSGTEGFQCSKCWRTSKTPSMYCPTCGNRNYLEEQV